ncbi:hypothetical protein [uncultured Draconibacterium sp.]|uniref:hypothetical protein n=1 Tax=uncultured Draconibacterium sp. TaxID=1573823 RepID=UPI0025DB499C|nr:hypothetical protein [uncultured Draconibacterium sp.]
MKKIDIEFLRLTTDICYIIGGYFGGTGLEENVITFMPNLLLKDPDKYVYLDLNQNMIFVSDEFTRLQHFALEKVANDHGFGYDIFHDSEE